MTKPSTRADKVPLGRFDLTSQLLAIEMLERGHEPVWHDRDFFSVDIDRISLGFMGTHTPTTNTVAVRAAKRKDIAAAMLRRANVSTADSAAFDHDQSAFASDFALSLESPVVIKPVNGRKGRHVTVGLTPGPDFERAFKLASGNAGRVLVERQFANADEARFLVVGEKCVAVYGKKPPSVVGDGHHSVRELIDHKNRKRRTNPHLRSRPIVMNEHRLSFLAKQSYTLDHVPASGTTIILDLNANVSAGGDSFDRTDTVHPSYKSVASAAAMAVANLDPAGVDIMAHDFSRPANAQNHIVCEVNSSPALGAHHFPVEGLPRNVAGAIISHTLQQVLRT